MPTYDYECPKCGHTFEKFQSMSDPPLKTCPKCKSRRVKRLIGTGAGLLFKGSGFYITDYRSSQYKEAAKSDSGAASPTASGGKSDSKPKAPDTPAKVDTPAKADGPAKTDRPAKPKGD